MEGQGLQVGVSGGGSVFRGTHVLLDDMSPVF